MSSRHPTVREEALLHIFGDTVRTLRLESGVSQEALALRAGLDRSYVGQVERGERNVTLLNIVKLAGALDLPADELLRHLSASTEAEAS